MDRDERKPNRLPTVDRDTPIQVVVNAANVDDGTIDLGRVLHNFKLRSRIYAWVLLLCLAAGICASLLWYQFTAPPLTVSSLVTLTYDVPNPLLDPAKNPEYDPSLLLDETIPALVPVGDLTAPNGSALDLNQVSSSYVLQKALSGLELSHPVSLTNLRANIRIDKILTGDSLRQQEVISSLIENKNNSAYTEMQNVELTYNNQFIVSLSNGFGDEDSRVKHYLTDSELALVLNRILAAYNQYLVSSYADFRLPGDQISIIDTETLDLPESLELLRTAVNDLYAYCDGKPEAVKSYRSWRTGRSLSDLMEDLDQIRRFNVDYLYSDVSINSIVRDRDAMIDYYQYQLQGSENALSLVQQTTANTQRSLDSYKNDRIYVSTEATGTTKSTESTTDYYNRMVLLQAQNYEEAALLQSDISNLEDQVDSLTNASPLEDCDARMAELTRAVEMSNSIYGQICAQMEEILASPFYSTYAEHSVAQGKSVSFITGSLKKVAIGAFAGLIIGLGLWFLSALAPEFRRREESGEEAVER